MLKYSLILIGIYVLYYGGNIVYDLFLQKEKTAVTDEAEEFSLVSFAKTESPPESRIEIDDVENIRTPKSFQKVHPPLSVDPSKIFEPPDLEEMRRKFEAEEEMDGDIPRTESPEEIKVSETKEESEQPEKKSATEPEEKVESQTEAEEIVQIPKPTLQEENDQYWKKMVSLAHTSIKLVKNYDGEKVYHSTQ